MPTPINTQTNRETETATPPPSTVTTTVTDIYTETVVAREPDYTVTAVIGVVATVLGFATAKLLSRRGQPPRTLHED